jgi:hypothetical protein
MYFSQLGHIVTQFRLLVRLFVTLVLSCIGLAHFILLQIRDILVLPLFLLIIATVYRIPGFLAAFATKPSPDAAALEVVNVELISPNGKGLIVQITCKKKRYQFISSCRSHNDFL